MEVANRPHVIPDIILGHRYSQHCVDNMREILDFLGPNLYVSRTAKAELWFLLHHYTHALPVPDKNLLTAWLRDYRHRRADWLETIARPEFQTPRLVGNRVDAQNRLREARSHHRVAKRNGQINLNQWVDFPKPRCFSLRVAFVDRSRLPRVTELLQLGSHCCYCSFPPYWHSWQDSYKRVHSLQWRLCSIDFATCKGDSKLPAIRFSLMQKLLPTPPFCHHHTDNLSSESNTCLACIKSSLDVQIRDQRWDTIKVTWFFLGCVNFKDTPDARDYLILIVLSSSLQFRI